MTHLLLQRPVLVFLQVLEKERLGESIHKRLGEGALVGGGDEIDTAAELKDGHTIDGGSR
jgi:hypothetical protein